MGKQEGNNSLFYNLFLLGQEQMKNVALHSEHNEVPEKENPWLNFFVFDGFYFPKDLKSHCQRLQRLISIQDCKVSFQ